MNSEKVLDNTIKNIKKTQKNIIFFRKKSVDILKIFYDYPDILKWKIKFHCFDEQLKNDTFNNICMYYKNCFKKSENLIDLFVELKQIHSKNYMSNFENIDTCRKNFDLLMFEITWVKCMVTLRKCKMYELYMLFVLHVKIYSTEYDEKNLDIDLLNHKFANYIPNLGYYKEQHDDIKNHLRTFNNINNNKMYLNDIPLYLDVNISRTIIEMIHIIDYQYEQLFKLVNNFTYLESIKSLYFTKQQLQNNITKELHSCKFYEIKNKNLIWFKKSDYNIITNDNIFISNYNTTLYKEDEQCIDIVKKDINFIDSNSYYNSNSEIDSNINVNTDSETDIETDAEGEMETKIEIRTVEELEKELFDNVNKIDVNAISLKLLKSIPFKISSII